MSQDIVRDFERVSTELVAQAADFQAAILADVAGRRGTMHARVAPVHHSMQVAGPAFTVEVRPGDNLMIHAAIALAQPGDVLVIDGKGDQTSALMGTIMMTACRQLGLAGVVMDGAARDSLARRRPREWRMAIEINSDEIHTTPAPSATVMVLRDSAGGIEVLGKAATVYGFTGADGKAGISAKAGDRLTGAVLIWLGRTQDVLRALRNPRMLGMASMTAKSGSMVAEVLPWRWPGGQAGSCGGRQGDGFPTQGDRQSRFDTPGRGG